MNLSFSHLLSPARARQIRRYFRDLKLTIICGFLTILVLRGILGGDKFGTPQQDFEDIKEHLARVHGVHRKQLSSRAIVEEVATEKFRQNVAIRESSNHIDADEKASDGLGTGAKLPLIPITNLGIDISKHGSPSHGQSPEPKIMLFLSGSQPSFCAEDPTMNYQFMLKSMKNKMDYCRLHGMEMFFADMTSSDDATAGKSVGVIKQQEAALMREMMVKHPEVEWIWWMHRDTMVTDMAFEMRTEQYEGFNMVVYYGSMVEETVRKTNQQKERGLKNRDHHRFHESFLLRNCAWSVDLLERWAATKSEEEDEEEEEDRAKIVVLRHNLHSDLQQSLIADEIHKENSSSLLQVHEGSRYPSNQSNALQDESDAWPFLTQFSGNCKRPCRVVHGDRMRHNGSDAPCFQQMQRAFNFAENQVLQLYGFYHNSLSSDKLSRLDDEEGVV